MSKDHEFTLFFFGLVLQVIGGVFAVAWFWSHITSLFIVAMMIGGLGIALETMGMWAVCEWLKNCGYVERRKK